MSEAFTDPALLLMPSAVPPSTAASFFDPALMLMPWAVAPIGPSGATAIWLRRRRRQED